MTQDNPKQKKILEDTKFLVLLLTTRKNTFLQAVRTETSFAISDISFTSEYEDISVTISYVDIMTGLRKHLEYKTTLVMLHYYYRNDDEVLDNILEGLRRFVAEKLIVPKYFEDLFDESQVDDTPHVKCQDQADILLKIEVAVETYKMYFFKSPTTLVMTVKGLDALVDCLKATGIDFKKAQNTSGEYKFKGMIIKVVPDAKLTGMFLIH